jgi:hypothetical protein
MQSEWFSAWSVCSNRGNFHLSMLARFLAPALAIILLTENIGSAQSAIPQRDPAVGEPRPGWWLSCWAGHVVVLKGRLRVNHVDNEPNVIVSLNTKGAAKTLLDARDERRFTRLAYDLGEMEVQQFLFASPGIDFLDLQIRDMKAGHLHAVKVLVQCGGGKGLPLFTLLGVKPGAANEGIFVFSYSESFGLPLVLSDVIPNESLGDALAVFRFREKYNYHGVAKDPHSP